MLVCGLVFARTLFSSYCLDGRKCIPFRLKKICSERNASQQCVLEFSQASLAICPPSDCSVGYDAAFRHPLLSHEHTVSLPHGVARRRNSIFSVQCVDLNECLSNPCGSGAKCINQYGGYVCECPPGAKGDPYTGCGVLDLCQSSPCGLNARCHSEGGTYRSVSSTII